MIRTEGRWSIPLFACVPQWDLNYSDILTKLIQYAGRYCESYASDLFIIWNYCVERKLKNPDLESFTLKFGFREMGVDEEVSYDPDRNTVTRHLNENYYYYRKVATLEVNIDDNKIEMILN